MGEVGLVVDAVVGALVWLLANAVYLDKKLSGRHGFGRLVAFWVGLPLTFFTMLIVREGSTPRLSAPEDDEGGLLDEVRRDRTLRGGADAPDRGPTLQPDAGDDP